MYRRHSHQQDSNTRVNHISTDYPEMPVPITIDDLGILMYPGNRALQEKETEGLQYDHSPRDHCGAQQLTVFKMRRRHAKHYDDS